MVYCLSQNLMGLITASTVNSKDTTHLIASSSLTFDNSKLTQYNSSPPPNFTLDMKIRSFDSSHVTGVKYDNTFLTFRDGCSEEC